MRYLILFLAFITACSPKKEKEVVAEKHLVILPKADGSTAIFTQSKIGYLFNLPLYIGEMPDSIDLKKVLIYDTIRFGENDSLMGFKINSVSRKENSIYENESYRLLNHFNPVLSIKVDTSVISQMVENILFCLNQFDSENDLRKDLSFQFYPMIIKNQSNDSLLFYNPELFLEVKDMENKWRKVLYPKEMKCVTGEPLIFVAPGEIMVIAAPVFSGTYKTRFRWYYQEGENKFYSNEYSGTINPKIFR